MSCLHLRPELLDPGPSAALRGSLPTLHQVLSQVELLAVRHLVVRILEEVPATLVQASLFGSKARGRARPDSDVDVLLVFRDLPPDREPQATHAESIAHQVAELTDVPVTVWSVALVDLESGCRTPMLVDAMADALTVWCWPEPLACIDFRAADALHCCAALLGSVAEGSVEYADARAIGNLPNATRRARDDIVRLCTALLLLRGITRPRRGEVVQECVRLGLIRTKTDPAAERTLDWVRNSFGPDGRQDDGPVAPPDVPEQALTEFVEGLIERVAEEAAALRGKLPSRGTRRGIRV
ncbi:MAG: hypothetical protein GEU90_08650 [Gemmatimonas sp.]|nr:hypothetical protein [Gemmatimonas sp.]